MFKKLAMFLKKAAALYLNKAIHEGFFKINCSIINLNNKEHIYL